VDRRRNLGYLFKISSYPRHYLDLLEEGRHEFERIIPRSRPVTRGASRQFSSAGDHSSAIYRKPTTAPAALASGAQKKKPGSKSANSMSSSTKKKGDGKSSASQSKKTKRPFSRGSPLLTHGEGSLGEIKPPKEMMEDDDEYAELKYHFDSNSDFAVESQQQPEVEMQNNSHESEDGVLKNAKDVIAAVPPLSSVYDYNMLDLILDNRSIKAIEDEESAKKAIHMSTDDFADLGIVDDNPEKVESVEEVEKESRPSSGWSGFAEANLEDDESDVLSGEAVDKYDGAEWEEPVAEKSSPSPPTQEAIMQDDSFMYQQQAETRVDHSDERQNDEMAYSSQEFETTPAVDIPAEMDTNNANSTPATELPADIDINNASSNEKEIDNYIDNADDSLHLKDLNHDSFYGEVDEVQYGTGIKAEETIQEVVTLEMTKAASDIEAIEHTEVIAEPVAQHENDEAMGKLAIASEAMYSAEKESEVIVETQNETTAVDVYPEEAVLPLEDKDNEAILNDEIPQEAENEFAIMNPEDETNPSNPPPQESANLESDADRTELFNPVENNLMETSIIDETPLALDPIEPIASKPVTDDTTEDVSKSLPVPLPPIESNGQTSATPSNNPESRPTSAKTPLPPVPRATSATSEHESRPVSGRILGSTSRPLSGFIEERAGSAGRKGSLPKLVNTMQAPSSRPLSAALKVISNGDIATSSQADEMAKVDDEILNSNINDDTVIANESINVEQQSKAVVESNKSQTNIAESTKIPSRPTSKPSSRPISRVLSKNDIGKSSKQNSRSGSIVSRPISKQNSKNSISKELSSKEKDPSKTGSRSSLGELPALPV
jgi:hypothetical protein